MQLRHILTQARRFVNSLEERDCRQRLNSLLRHRTPDP